MVSIFFRDKMDGVFFKSESNTVNSYMPEIHVCEDIILQTTNLYLSTAQK